MNLFARFRKLIAQPPLQVGVVVDITGGVATLALPGGSLASARGRVSVGERVFFRDGVVEGAAPALTYVEYDI